MGSASTIAGLPEQTQVQVAPGFDLSRLDLSAEEAQLLTHAGRAVSLAELISSAGLPPRNAELAAGALLRRKVLIEAPESDPVELSPERRAEIAQLESKIGKANFFELLGVSNGTSAELCKEAYYQLSMRLHPDRHYGKNLGSFRPRIERVFRVLTEAQQTLTDLEKRRAYQNAHPEWFRTPEPIRVHDSKRADDRARRIAHHPYLAKIARQHELLSRARKAVAAGQAGQAIIDLEQLLKMEPENAQAKSLLAEAQAKKAATRGQQVFEEGLRLLDGANSAAAVHSFLEALEKAPSREVCIKGHEAALNARDVKNAKLFAQKWVELEPRSARAHVALSEILERLGLQKNAKREAEEALKLEPENKVAKALCAKLRWA